MATKIMQMPCSVASNISAAIETLSNCVPADAQDHVKTDEHFEKMVSRYDMHVSYVPGMAFACEIPLL